MNVVAVVDRVQTVSNSLEIKSFFYEQDLQDLFEQDKCSMGLSLLLYS
jgi:hypothetical protein